MSGPKRDYERIYEDLMRHAGERKRILAQRALEREKLFRERANKRLSKAARAEADAMSRAIDRIDRELTKLIARLERVSTQESRIFLKAEIAHLRSLRDRLAGRKAGRRKPPEAGIAVPAISPNGPLPKGGGAQVPLDFERR